MALFDIEDGTFAQVVSNVEAALYDVHGGSITLVAFAIDDETGAIIGGTSLPPEQLGQFLQMVSAQQRAGEYSFAAATPETKQ